MLTELIYDILIILSAGLFADVLCRRVGVPPLVGYLVVGAVIGQGTLGLVRDTHHEIEHIAEVGVFLLLFSIGLEFSLEELQKLGRHFFIGGGVQMLLVAAPVAAVMAAFGIDWQASLLIATACAFSSTVLVFKALSEWGQLAVPHGRRAVGILLFQDAALIPLLLVIPLITGSGEAAGAADYAILAVKSTLFIASVIFVRRLMAEWIIPWLAGHRSPDLIVLFTLVALGGITLAAYSVGLPPAVGAFAAGLVFSGNRWSQQVDALILPFRESFAVIFFVSLGLIANPKLFWLEPVLMLGSLAGIVVLKAATATIALRLTGLRWRPSTGMGIGLAHIGEFAFVLVLLGWEAGAITDAQYQRVVSISLASLILTPLLMKFGLRWAQSYDTAGEPLHDGDPHPPLAGQAVVIGAGPTGRQVASRLETAGNEVCVVDLSPINLYPFSQQGFRTVAGDASQAEILEHAHIEHATMVIVCISDDDAAKAIAQTVRGMNPSGFLLMRCRYHENIEKLIRLGADHVVSEEAKASAALIGVLDRRILAQADAGNTA